MHPPQHRRPTTAIESAALAFFLLAASCITLFLYAFLQEQEEEGRYEERIEELAASAAGMAIRIRRQIEGHNNDDNGPPRKKRRRSSRFLHERARICIETDFFSPTPVFHDRQFERIFRVTKGIVEYTIQVCAKSDPFFTDIQDISGRYGIAPVAKVLMALKLVAYGCSPSAFLSYFQMSETTARKCYLKYCRIVSSDDDLQSVYGRSMTRSDARRVSALHQGRHGIAGMIGSLDCMHVRWMEELSGGVAGLQLQEGWQAHDCLGSNGGSQLMVLASIIWLAWIIE